MSIEIRDRIRVLVERADMLEDRITHVADILFGEVPAKADGSKSNTAPCPGVISETHLAISCLEDHLREIQIQLDRLAGLTASSVPVAESSLGNSDRPRNHVNHLRNL